MSHAMDAPVAPSSAGEDPTAHLLEVENLHVEFRTPRGVVNALNGVTYHVDDGETLAIMGESGSGKSVSARAVMGILERPGRITAGSVRFRGSDLLSLAEEERRRYRGMRISVIFQDALSALNPVFPVGWQIGETLRQHKGFSKKQAKQRAIELMDMVKIPSASQRVDAYPHEFSGGMRQRVLIAMALALSPDLLIADEPTTALDVTVQAQIMTLLAELQAQMGMGMILITHDLGVVAEVADRVAVMYAGSIVETGGCTEIYSRPAHPYTLGLMRSIPRADSKGSSLEPISGSPPDLIAIPPGCPFHPRCSFRRDRCTYDVPPPYHVDGPERISACHYFDEVVRTQ